MIKRCDKFFIINNKFIVTFLKYCVRLRNPSRLSHGSVMLMHAKNTMTWDARYHEKFVYEESHCQVLKTRKKKEKKTFTSIFFCHNMLPRACNPWTRHLWEPPQSNQNTSFFFPWKFFEVLAVSLKLTRRPYISNFSVKSWILIVCYCIVF